SIDADPTHRNLPSFPTRRSSDLGNPRLDDANHARIRDYLAARKPQLVFMPHGNDSNVTHQRTYALFRAVALAEQWTMWALLNQEDRKSTRLNSSHVKISYAVFCL